MTKENIAREIENGQAVLGIEFGSTRIKAVLIDSEKNPVAQGGFTVADMDLVEANEAFAAQSLAVRKDLGLDPEKTNVNGGAIAIGHPIGASGCRILITLIYEMMKRDSKYGLATLCIGGGMGTALVVER